VPVLQTLLARLDEREFPTPAPMTEFLLRQGEVPELGSGPAQLARAGRAADRPLTPRTRSSRTARNHRPRCHITWQTAHAPELRKPDRGASRPAAGVLSAEPRSRLNMFNKPSRQDMAHTLPKLETRTNSPMTDTQDLRAANEPRLKHNSSARYRSWTLRSGLSSRWRISCICLQSRRSRRCSPVHRRGRQRHGATASQESCNTHRHGGDRPGSGRPCHRGKRR